MNKCISNFCQILYDKIGINGIRAYIKIDFVRQNATKNLYMEPPGRVTLSDIVWQNKNKHDLGIYKNGILSDKTLPKNLHIEP